MASKFIDDRLFYSILTSDIHLNGEKFKHKGHKPAFRQEFTKDTKTFVTKILFVPLVPSSSNFRERWPRAAFSFSGGASYSAEALWLKKDNMKKILITGGAGFIGSHVIRLFVTKYPEYQVYNLDKLTYAGNLENLKDIENNPNYTFIKGDIVDDDFIQTLFTEHHFDGVIHLAAESHVDRSISNPMEFIFTNIAGG